MGSHAMNVLDWGFLDVDGPLTDNHKNNFNLSEGRITPSSAFKDGIRFQSVFFLNDDDLPVVFDTGASISVSPRGRDFISWEARGNMQTKLNGISGSADVLGIGIIHWTIRDDRGRCHTIQTRAYYVPSAKVRLLSPHRYLHEQQSGSFIITPTESIFRFPDDKSSQLTFRMWTDSNTRSDLPIAFIVSSPTERESVHDHAYLELSILDTDNVNLAVTQKELMLWHFRLGHFHLEWIQKLFRVREGEAEAILPTKHKANACKLPQCAACHFTNAMLSANG
jgi:hypothetical protein